MTEQTAHNLSPQEIQFALWLRKQVMMSRRMDRLERQQEAEAKALAGLISEFHDFMSRVDPADIPFADPERLSHLPPSTFKRKPR